MTEYTDYERVQIAKAEYNKYKVGKLVTTGKGRNKTTIGYVAQVNNKLDGGETSYVVTDLNPEDPHFDASKVKRATVLYQGSHDAEDWVVNDLPDGAGIALSGRPTQVDAVAASPQLKTAASTLKGALKSYPHAQFEVYGHSLGSMDGQYALASMDKQDVRRIDGAYLYEGPNMYAFLDDNQREVSAEFSKTHAIHNYVDHRDIVPIGYGKNKPHIGDMFFIDSRKASSIVSQHSWGGYHYDEFGNIVLDSKHCLQAVDDSLAFGVAELAKLRKGFSQSGGGLSSAERIYLDASEAKLMVSGQRELLNSLVRMRVEDAGEERHGLIIRRLAECLRRRDGVPQPHPRVRGARSAVRRRVRQAEHG